MLCFVADFDKEEDLIRTGNINLNTIKSSYRCVLLSMAGRKICQGKA